MSFDLRGEIQAFIQPEHLSLGQQVTVPVRVRNTGSTAWSSSMFPSCFLSYHWYTLQGEHIVFDGLRTALPGSIDPSAEMDCYINVGAPPAPGRYRLELDLVAEGVSWMGGGPQWEVEVISPENDRRVTLVSPVWLPNDAVGNQILLKLRLFLNWGYLPLLFIGAHPAGFPDDLRPYYVVVQPDQLLNNAASNPALDWALSHIKDSEIAIFDYPVYYSLIEAIKVCPAQKIIFDYHGVTPPHLWRGQDGRFILEYGIKRLNLVAYADYAIAHSEFTRNELIGTGLIAQERVSVIPYAVPQEIFRPSEKIVDIRRRYGLGDGPMLLYVGRFAYNKRIDILVDALAKVRKRYPTACLLLVGDDQSPAFRDDIAAIRARISELELESAAIFTGPVNHHELPPFYNACDLYVTSSLHEGFCIPVVEAMACGKPVVASASAALPWTVGDAGLTFSAEQVDECVAAICKILDSANV
ncbi:MAG: hypothetical protein KatS3mg057_2663 [Herpetosiphonaceae bacterium]|nr:MAG: hypothetical protein KatS3mg057_2663 [Herpetosiphonaceae bacterium]